MSAPSPFERLHLMYDVRVPEPSGVWRSIRAVEYCITPRSRFMHAVITLQRTSPIPVYEDSRRLANGDYLISVTRNQLERIVRQGLSTPLSQL